MAIVASSRSRGRLIRQRLPEAPSTYDQTYIAQLADAVNDYMLQATAPADVSGARFICSAPVRIPDDMPDVKTLPTGMLYLAPVAAMPAAQGSVANPVGTTATTWRMTGLSAQFTPTVSSTTATFAVSGNIGNTSNGDTSLVMVYGTGTPPANGAVLTGTQVGGVLTVTSKGAGVLSPFSKTVLLTGLTPGTTYWVGPAVEVTAGTSIVSNVYLAGWGIVTAPQYFFTIVTPQDPSA